MHHNELHERLHNQKAIESELNAIKNRPYWENVREKSQFYMSTTTLPFLLVLAWILLQGGNCSIPLHSWLCYFCLIFLCIAIMLGIYWVWRDQEVRKSIEHILACLSVIQFGLYLVGCFWFFSGKNDCKAKWYSGYLIGLFMIIYFFVQVGLGIIIFFFAKTEADEHSSNKYQRISRKGTREMQSTPLHAQVHSHESQGHPHYRLSNIQVKHH